jgi:uncharacterized membrane protein
MGRALRIVLGLLAGSILGAVLGFVVWIGNATPTIRSPLTVFTVVGAVGGAALGARARKGRGVGRVSLVIVLLALAACAVGAFFVVKVLWHEFESGMIHP